jgi:glycyl-tRNA synthetase
MPVDPFRRHRQLAKRRGFVFQSSEIYGGTRSAWDYGPLGVELKENVRRQWWRAMVQQRDDIVGLDSAVILARAVWEASGHVREFTDPLTECAKCHKRFRADHLEEAFLAKKPGAVFDLAELNCPNCGNKGTFTEPRMFNGMMKTYLGAVESEEGLHYLRPRPHRASSSTTTTSHLRAQEAAVRHRPGRQELPQRDHAGQLHLPYARVRADGDEFFVEPGTDEKWHEYWLDERWNWYTDLGIDPENMRFSSTPRRSCRTTPSAPWTSSTASVRRHRVLGAGGRGQPYGLRPVDALAGVRRGPVLLRPEKNERWFPYVIEPAAGLTRAVLAFMLDAYDEDEAPNTKGGVDKRTVMRFDKRLAPIKVAVLPLSRNEQLSPEGPRAGRQLRKRWIGGVRRRPGDRPPLPPPGRDRHAVLLTVDFDTLEDNAVTVRDRDSMAQERIPLDNVERY